MESLDNDRNKQQQSLQQKIAEKKRMRNEALKKKHDSEMAKELLEQKKEMVDAERNAVKHFFNFFHFRFQLDFLLTRIYIFNLCICSTIGSNYKKVFDILDK